MKETLNFKKAIDKILSLKEMNIKQLAEKSNLSIILIDDILEGRTKPKKPEIEAMAEALNVPKETILLLSIDRDNVSEEKRALYDLLYTDIENVILNLIK